MKLISLIIFSCCTLLNFEKSPSSYTWKYIDSSIAGKDSIIIRYPESDKRDLPFIWQEINHAQIDRIIKHYDNSSAGKRNIDLPSFDTFRNFYILCREKKNISIGNCSLDAYIFSINKGTEFFEHDRFDLLYIKKIGFVAAIHTTRAPSFDWEKLALIDIQDISNQSIVDKVGLQNIVYNFLDQ